MRVFFFPFSLGVLLCEGSLLIRGLPVQLSTSEASTPERLGDVVCLAGGSGVGLSVGSDAEG